MSFQICVFLKFFFFPTPYLEEYFEYFLHQFSFHFSSIELNLNPIVELNSIESKVNLVELE
jgi:hypothetical protein